MTSSDSRLVQTAVIGSRTSGTAIILPTDAYDLERWRRRHPRYTYWCGTQLGGCGNELSDRLYRDKVCHFAHRPNTSCHRTATGANSADHLFIREDLAGWAGRKKLKGRASLRNLGSGPGDAVDFRVGEARQHVRFQFSRLSYLDWVEARAQLNHESETLDWVFGPGSTHRETMEELYDEYGYLLRFRFETMGAVRRIRIRAEEPRRSTEWVPLDACSMTSLGLRVPGAEPRRRISSRPVVGSHGAQDASVRRSREETTAALKEALIGAAGFRTRPTWEALCRTAGVDVLGLSVSDRVSLLVSVDAAAGSDGGLMLSALLRTEDGDPPAYVGDIAAAVGCGAPASAMVLKRWCQREVDRAYAVYGVPSRTAPERLQLTADGRIAQQRMGEPEHRTIVHVKGGPVADAIRQSDMEILYALRGARQRTMPKRAAALLARAGKALTRALPEQQRAQLMQEMEITRRWLATKPRMPEAKTGTQRKAGTGARRKTKQARGARRKGRG